MGALEGSRPEPRNIEVCPQLELPFLLGFLCWKLRSGGGAALSLSQKPSLVPFLGLGAHKASRECCPACRKPKMGSGSQGAESSSLLPSTTYTFFFPSLGPTHLFTYYPDGA